MQILRYDQARERTHRQLMRLQYLAGNRTGALRQFERCAAVLEKELGIQPAASTAALYEQIRDDQPVFSTQAPDLHRNQAANDDTAVSLAETIKQIRQLQMELNHTQRQIQQKIATVEMLLHDQRPSPNATPPA
jgi:DNA-binding SARP family transcriptional activator